MLTPAAKRRRVAAANETLKKPFKSPLVKRGPERVIARSSESNPAGRQQGMPCRDSANAGSCPQSGSQASPEKSHKAAILSRPGANEPNLEEPGEKVAGSLLTAVRKHQAVVDQDIKQLDEEIERASRPNERLAVDETKEHSRESELNILTAKWRRAARTAAEELFPPAKERYLRFVVEVARSCISPHVTGFWLDGSG